MSATKTEKLLLSLPEVGELLGMKLPTVKKRVAAGVIPSVKDGRLRRVRRADLEKYVESLPTAQPTAS